MTVPRVAQMGPCKGYYRLGGGGGGGLNIKCNCFIYYFKMHAWILKALVNIVFS